MALGKIKSVAEHNSHPDKVLNSEACYRGLLRSVSSSRSVLSDDTDKFLMPSIEAPRDCVTSPACRKEPILAGTAL